MADGTHIEWTDATWNVVTGCTRVSPGCTHCYIERTPPFRMARRRFDGTDVGATTGVQLHPDRLEQPYRWVKPRLVFVNSLADLFHADVPDDFIARVFATMAVAPRHTFQVLTKRHARMRALLSDDGFRSEVAHEINGLVVTDGVPDPAYLHDFDDWWPLPHVWLGVSVEDQHWADVRIPALLATPAAVRWISAEPLLGSVDLRATSNAWGGYLIDGIDWVVAGGESGPRARPMHPDWARSLRDQCDDHDLPFLFKQWGNWRPAAIDDRLYLTRNAGMLSQDGTWESGEHVDVCYPNESDGTAMVRVSKAVAGRQLDGRTHNAFPPVRALVAP